MPPRKYIKKVVRKGRSMAKKRYITRTGGYRVNRMAKDRDWETNFTEF